MNRATALHNLEKLKGYKHYNVEAYKHIAKVFEYLFYEIDRLNQIAVEAPSVYGSYVEDPNYKDFSDGEDDETVELPEVKDDDIEASYVEDTSIPLVLATNALLTPFQPLSSEPAKEEEAEAKPETAETTETNREAPGDSGGDAVTWTISKDDIKPVKPKRLKIVGETDKTSLHSEGLKRVKENLRRKKSKKE